MRALDHLRWRRRVSPLAAGDLADPERAAVQQHIAHCPRCRRQWDATLGVLSLIQEDAAALPPAPLAVTALLRRVEERLDAGVGAPSSIRRAWLSAAAAALATLAVLFPPDPVRAPAPDMAAGGEGMLRRMERSVSREQAARYLSDAQDVLVTVAGPTERCRRAEERVDVAEEARRSRDLLARRTLLVDLEEPEVASASPVLEEVEHVLREVAAFSSCVRQGELDLLEREIARRRLLMRIDVATRELLG